MIERETIFREAKWVGPGKRWAVVDDDGMVIKYFDNSPERFGNQYAAQRYIAQIAAEWQAIGKQRGMSGGVFIGGVVGYKMIALSRPKLVETSPE